MTDPIVHHVTLVLERRLAAAASPRVSGPWFLLPVALGGMAGAGFWCRSARIRGRLPLVR